jgi:hypothetical protein
MNTNIGHHTNTDTSTLVITWKNKNDCMFGFTLDRINFDRIDFGIIDFNRINFSIMDLCLDTFM